MDKITAETRTFINPNNDFTFQRKVIKMQITNKLKADFIGVNYPKEGYTDAPCKIRETHVANAAQYYGIKPITQAISNQSSKIHVPTIMEKLIPVNQIETAIVDRIEGVQTLTLDSGYDEQTPIEINALTHSHKEDITLANRSYNYTAQLINPMAGSITAKFLSQGVWYELKDDKNGKLIGASQRHGSGSINYDTGSVVLSCGELPDVGSAIIVNYSKNIFKKPKNPQLHAYIPITMNNMGVDIRIQAGSKTAQVVGNQIQGQFDGSYDGINKTLKLSPSLGKIPIEVHYQSGQQRQVKLMADNLNIRQAPIAPKSVRLIATFAINDEYNEQTNEYAYVDSTKNLAYYDDGEGNLISHNADKVGTINYQTGQIVITNRSFSQKLRRDLVDKVQVGTRRIYYGDFNRFNTEPVYENIVRESNLTVEKTYQLHSIEAYFVSSTQDATERFAPQELIIDIHADTAYSLVHNLSFTLDNKLYYEKDNQIFTDERAVGKRVGNRIYLSQFEPFRTANVKSLLVQTEKDRIKHLTFTTPKLRHGSLQLDVNGQKLKANLNGQIVGSDEVSGFVDSNMGIVMLHFNAEVSAVVWQAVALSYLPVSSKVVKIDTVRLPQDGRVPIFRRGDTMLITNTQSQDIGSAHTGGQTVQLERDDVDRICVTDSNGKPVNAELWTYDLAAGSITWVKSLDLSEYQMPLMVKHTQEERNVILEADIDGTLSLRFATKRAYPIKNTYVSSVLIGDTLRVRASVPFTQRNWDSVWRDTPNGAQLLNKLNLKDYPMVLTDDGAITDRWLIRFASSSQFELYSEALGYVGKFDTLTDLAPINPATNKPYFTIPKQAFGTSLAGGAPWGSQDVIRFDTWGTLMPVWVLCAVQPTANTLQEEDGFSMCVFGDTTEN